MNIAQAANSSIVSCTGADCSLCSLLETVSRIYNFFLAVSFAVAVLVLVVAGVNYLLNASDRSKLQKSLYYLKSGIGGFALILLGWLVVQTAVRAVGYPNAGSWWAFECDDGTEKTAIGPQRAAGLQSEYYNGLQTFPDLAAYLASGEKTGKITGPLDADTFSRQLKALQEGEILHFLAPAGIDGSAGIEKMFLPLLTAMREGDSLNLESTGEYWNIIQKEWPNLRSQLGDSVTVDLLDKYLANGNGSDDQSLLNGSGDVLNLQDNQNINSLYNQLAKILKDSESSGDRSSLSLGSAAGNSSLSELLAILSGSDSNSPEQKEKILAILAAESLKLTDILMVDKEYDYGLYSNQAQDRFSVQKLHCENSGGEWIGDYENVCHCQEGYQLQQGGNCQSVELLEKNCGESGGTWQKVSEGFSPPALCGESTGAWGDWVFDVDSVGQRANMSEIVPDRSYCKCGSGSCIDGLGNCRDAIKDDDGDKIGNSADHCPNTPAADKSQVNKTKTSQYYGCSCFEIGDIPKECPPDQCVGDNWVNYPAGDKQECKDGKLLPFSCQPLEKMFDATCAEKNILAGGGDGTDGTGTGTGKDLQNANTNSWDSQTKNWTQSPYNNTSAKKTQGSSQGNPIGGGSSKSSKANSGKRKIDDSRLGNPKDPLQDGGIVSTNNHGSPLGVKAALKRIYQRDKLRYLMFFKYVNYVEPTGGGGLTWSHRGGVIGVNFGLPVKLLDHIIIHELTHRADFSWDGWIDRSMEHVAVAHQVGSVGRIKESPGQKEEVKVTLSEGKDLEVRGYLSRWLDRDVNPRGDMNPSDIGFYCGYAKGEGRVNGNWLYGWPPGGEQYTLRLNDAMENRVKIVIERMNQRNCMSRPPDDLPQLTEENGYTEEQLKGCKEAKPIKIGG